VGYAVLVALGQLSLAQHGSIAGFEFKLRAHFYLNSTKFHSIKINPNKTKQNKFTNLNKLGTNSK
jgi:hypothetical protein